MGYTPRTLEAIVSLVEQADGMTRTEWAIDGWVHGARLKDFARTRDKLSESGILRRISAAVDLGFLESGRPDSPLADLRATYYRVTPRGAQVIAHSKDTGPASAAQQAIGQTVFGTGTQPS
jgi:hypothetical protein